MPVVDIPTVGQVEFPDSMSDAEIVSAIRSDILKTQITRRPETGGAAGATGMQGPRSSKNTPQSSNSGPQSLFSPPQSPNTLLTSGPTPFEAAQVPSQQQRVTQAAQALEAQRSAEFRQSGPVQISATDSPPIETPKVTSQDLTTLGVPPKLANPLAGAQQAVTGMVDFFLSPWGIATLGMGSLEPGVQKAFAHAYVGDMIRQSPDQIGKAYEAFKAGDTETGTRELAGASLSLLLAGHGVHEAFKPAAVRVAQALDAAVKGVPEMKDAVNEAAIKTLSVRDSAGNVQPDKPGAPSLKETLLPRSQAAVEAITESKPNEIQNQAQIGQEILPQEGQVQENVDGQKEALLEKPTPDAPGQAPLDTAAPTETAVTAADSVGADTPAESQANDQSQPEVPLSQSDSAAGSEVKPTAAQAKSKGTERPFDIIDAITEHVGTIRSKGEMRPGEEGYYGNAYQSAKSKSAARKLFGKGGQSPDDALETLRRAGFMSENATVDDLWEAVDRAGEARRAFARGETPEQKQEKFGNALKAQAAKKSSQVISVGDLAVGDKFRLAGEEMEVTAIDPDTGEVTVRDGKKFGVQTIPDGADIPTEKGSHVPAGGAGEDFPAEEPAQNVPKLRPGEKGTAEMFQGQDQPFNLAGETGTDQGRVQAEKAAAEKAKAEAKALQDKQQQTMVGMGGATPDEFAAPGTYASNMFAMIDKDNAEAGRPPMAPGEKRTWSQDEQHALARMNRDPNWIPDLIADVLKNPRPLLSWENAGLVFQRGFWKAELNNALKRVAQAFDDGREADLVSAKVDAGRFEDHIIELNKAVGRGGTGSEAGRSLQAQKMGVSDDLTLVEMRLRKRASVGGRPLTPDEEGQIAQLAKRAETAERQYQETVKSLQESQAKKELAEIKKRAAEDKIPKAHVQEIVDKILNTIHTRGNAARERLKGKLFTISPEVLKDLVEVGVDNIATIGYDLAKWSSKMVEDIGEHVKPHLQTIWEAAQHAYHAAVDSELKGKPEKIASAARGKATKSEPTVESVSEKIGAKVAKDQSDSITPQVKKLAEMFYAQGVKDLNPMIDSLHGVLKQFLPDITRQETMDALSGRGRFWQASQDEIKKGVRDLSTQARLVAHQIDVELGRPLPRTGYQPDKMSDAARREQAKLEEMKRRFGVNVTDPSTQLASSLQAAKTYLRNRMADLQEEIRTREKIVKTRTPLAPDAELESMRREYAEVKADHEAVFPKKPISDEQRIAAAHRALDRAISNLEGDLQAGRLFPEKRTAPALSTPELDAKRARLESLKAQRQELRGIANPKKTPLERALAARLSAVNRQIADYQDRIARRDFSPKTRTPITNTPELLAKVAERNRLKTDFEQMLAADRRAARPKWEKVMDAFVQWKRGMVLSSLGIVEKLTAAAFHRGVLMPTEQMISAAIGKATGLEGKIYGRFSVSNEMRGIAKTFTIGMKDAWEKLRKGETELDIAHGHRRMGFEGESGLKEKSSLLNPKFLEYIGFAHGALKAPIFRGAYERALAYIKDYDARHGIDATDAMAVLKQSNQAYEFAQRQIFLQDNFMVDGYRRFLSRLDQRDKATGKPNPTLKALSTLIKSELPIVKVPSNITGEAIEYLTGSMTGLPGLAKALRSGVDSLPAAEQDLILRKLSKGTLGAGAAVLIGFLLRNNISGFYLPGQRKRQGDMKPGEIKVLNYTVPEQDLHSPFFNAIMFGATVGRAADSKIRKSDSEPQGIPNGLLAATLGLAETTPFYREMKDLAQLSNPTDRQRIIGQRIQSALVPGAVSYIARKTDPTARAPRNIVEHVEMGIPGLREGIRRKVNR